MTATLRKLRVTTAHSVYVIDQEAGTLQREAIHDEASAIPELSEPKAYSEILSALVPGESVRVLYADGMWSVSTPIQSVEEL